MGLKWQHRASYPRATLTRLFVNILGSEEQLCSQHEASAAQLHLARIHSCMTFGSLFYEDGIEIKFPPCSIPEKLWTIDGDVKTNHSAAEFWIVIGQNVLKKFL